MNPLPIPLQDSASVLNPASEASTRSCELISLDEWQDFVDAHPESTPVHHRKWIELLVAHYGFKIWLPALRSDGEILAANAFLESRTPLGVRKIISLPFTDCTAPLCHEDELLHELVDYLRSEGMDGVQMISMRTDRRVAGFEHCQRWVRHRIQLTTEMTDLLPRLPSEVRRNVKRAVGNGLAYERRTDMQSIDDFYRLHVRTRRKLGMPVQSKRFFCRLHEFVIESGLGFVGLVRSSGRPIAAAVFMQHNGTLMYKYGASDPGMLAMRPNDFLVFNAIQSAAGDCHCFDFGVTDSRSEGLRRFKCKWGAVEENIYDVCIAGQPRGFAGDSFAVKTASLLIRRSPLFVCRALGQVFYKYGV